MFNFVPQSPFRDPFIRVIILQNHPDARERINELHREILEKYSLEDYGSGGFTIPGIYPYLDLRTAPFGFQTYRFNPTNVEFGKPEYYLLEAGKEFIGRAANILNEYLIP